MRRDLIQHLPIWREHFRLRIQASAGWPVRIPVGVRRQSPREIADAALWTIDRFALGWMIDVHVCASRKHDRPVALQDFCRVVARTPPPWLDQLDLDGAVIANRALQERDQIRCHAGRFGRASNWDVLRPHHDLDRLAQRDGAVIGDGIGALVGRGVDWRVIAVDNNVVIGIHDVQPEPVPLRMLVAQCNLQRPRDVAVRQRLPNRLRRVRCVVLRRRPQRARQDRSQRPPCGDQRVRVRGAQNAPRLRDRLAGGIDRHSAQAPLVSNSAINTSDNISVPA